MSRGLETNYSQRVCKNCCIQKCDKCGHVFARLETFMIKEEEVSWFRGDDIVTAYCASCCKVHNIPIPPPYHIKPNPRRCSQCDHLCKSPEGVLDHIRAKHPKVKEFMTERLEELQGEKHV